MNAFFYVSVLVGGALFGAGLTLATMVQPEVVLAFLRFDDWGLMLVLGSAVMITFAVYQLAPRLMKKPLFAEKFGAHALFGTRQTLVGAAIFGIGWGLSGVCPGPAIAGLGTGNWPLLYTLAGLFAGAWLQGWWASRSR